VNEMEVDVDEVVGDPVRLPDLFEHRPWHRFLL
jgi:hypothetical protein